MFFCLLTNITIDQNFIMEYRGIKASELIKQLKTYMNKFGDLYVCKEKNGNISSIYFINHYPNTDYFEIT